jgi:hypothetical protein
MRFLLALLAAAGAAAQSQRPPEPPTFERLLRKAAASPPGPCDWQRPDLTDWSNVEFRIFDEADKAVVARLNERPIALPAGAPARATEALQDLQRQSGEINRSWPEENRFQFEVMDVPPGLLVKMTFRNWQTFSYFAIPKRDGFGKPSSSWKANTAFDDHRSTDVGGQVWLELFPLARGPAKRARFLAEFVTTGCNGMSGAISYYAHEWDPEGFGNIRELIKLEGSIGIADPNSEFSAEGTPIHLRYCWFSAIDTWDNPSLCATESYDLSEDDVRFVGSEYDRPDLVALAKAIQYSESRDYPATLAYCGSADVAQQMVRDLPPSIGMPAFDSDPNDPVKRISGTREVVDFGTFHFEVEKRGERWLVVSFRMD